MIIAIIVLVVVIGIIFYIKRTPKDSVQNTETENNISIPSEVEDTTPIEIDNYSKQTLIDMENTVNVKIEEGNKINNSSALLKEKNLLGMKISNIRLAAEKGMTNFTADVENISNEDFKEKEITIIFKNEDGSEYGRLPGYLPDIKSGESSRIDSSTTDDLSNAYDFIIE